MFDQLPSWALEQYEGALPRGGLFRTSARRGVWIERVSFSYAGTYTAPGHAAIVTGKPPRDTGVAANKVHERRRGVAVSVVDDGTSAVFGHEGAFASPIVLRADTVGDALKRATGGRGRVVSLSLKDRSAVLMGGRRPDAAIWYDAAVPGFTTSRHYAARYPAWLARFRDAHPIERLLVPWVAEASVELLDQIAGPDDGPGEASWSGLGTVFPHDPRRSDHPLTALKALPALGEELLALADAAIAEYHLGEDDAPDLLAISISTTDYVGHAFGQDSWEYVECLLRLDAAVGTWLAGLERRHPIAVLVTSDHGAAPLPERTGRGGGLIAGRGRIDAKALAGELQQAVAAELGPGEWVEGYAPPFVYLTGAAERGARRERALDSAAEFLRRYPGIAWSGRVDRIQEGSGEVHLPPAEIRRAIELSVPLDATGDLLVVPASTHVVTEDPPRDRGTSHGSPWRHDREVPVLYFGPGVEAGRRVPETLPQEGVAATLAFLLGIGDEWVGQPLPHTR